MWSLSSFRGHPRAHHFSGGELVRQRRRVKVTSGGSRCAIVDAPCRRVSCGMLKTKLLEHVLKVFLRVKRHGAFMVAPRQPLDSSCCYEGQRIAHQKSTPQKTLWNVSDIFQWIPQRCFPMDFHFCEFWCTTFFATSYGRFSKVQSGKKWAQALGYLNFQSAF